MSQETITLKKSTVKMSIFVVIAFVIGFGLGNVFTFTSTAQLIAAPFGDTAAPTGNNNAPAAPTGSGVLMADIQDDDPFKGSVDAPIVLVEWSDFECPFCGRFYTETLPGLQENYIDTGKLKIVYRDFPLSFHPQANPAAEAAACANDQGKFWEFHDLIFANQHLLATNPYSQWAADLGINIDQFNDCVTSGTHKGEISADIRDGSAIGISGTPGFYLGRADGEGFRIVGAQPYNVFASAIDQLLA